MGTPISTAKGNMAYDSKYSKFTYGAPTIEPSQPSTPSTNATVEMNTLTKKTIDRMSDMASVIPAANASVALSYVHPSSLSVVVVVKVSSRGPEGRKSTHDCYYSPPLVVVSPTDLRDA